MVIGIERAIDIVEMEEKEQAQQRPHPQPTPHPVSPAPRETAQTYQGTENGEGLLAGDEEGGDELSEVQPGGPSTGEGRAEDLQAQGQPFPEKE